MDIAAFYAEDPRRQESEEVLYGDTWTDDDDPHATYRLALVEETGEVYAVREPHPGGLIARYLDALHVDQADVDQLRVEILATGRDVTSTASALEGWQQRALEENSLRWARERLSQQG